MADISMCSGEKCEAKHTCYRFTAKPNEYRQSYFANPPTKESGCEYYWNIN